MGMYGVQFGMDGLSLDGTTWYNPKTNDVIKIKSNYFEDNVMMIQTGDGRRLSLDKLSDYVQWKGKGEPPRSQPVHESTTELPPEVTSILDNNDMLPEDVELAYGKGVETPRPPLKLPDRHSYTQNGSNYSIIDRALTKASKPDCTLGLKWNKFPCKEIDMLLTVMDISKDEIADYYMNNIREEFNTFIQDLKRQFIEYINSKLGVSPQEKTDTPPRSKKQQKKKNV